MRTKLWLVALLGSAAIFAAAALRDPAPAPSSAATPASTATSTAAPSVPLPDFVSTSTPPAAGADPAPASTSVRSSVAPAATADDADDHPGARLDAATVRRLHGNRPLTASHPTMAAAIAVQERNSAWLMALPGVVGLGVGLNDDGAVALLVYTKADVPGLPAQVEGVPLAPYRSGPIVARTRQEGKVAPHAPPPGKGGGGGGGGGGTTLTPRSKWRPEIPIGVSVGPNTSISAGTLGCRIQRNGQTYALSNNHVFADVNNVAVSSILQPGRYDGGLVGADQIGTLTEFIPIVFSGAGNKVDAALASVPAYTDGSAMGVGKGTPPGGYGTPLSTPVLAWVSQPVQKYGRTTGQTAGTVKAINVAVNVDYGGGDIALFVGQFSVSGRKFSNSGDSGSLIVDGSKAPVGLLFAGGATTTFANTIQDVLAAFPGSTIDGD